MTRKREIGNYQGFEDSENLYNGARGDTNNPVGIGWLVHRAGEHARKFDGEDLPRELGRPCPRLETPYSIGFRKQSKTTETKPRRKMAAAPVAIELPYGVFDVADFIDQAEKAWFIDQWLEQQSFNLWSGPHGSLKTQDMLALTLSGTTGLPFYGQQVMTTGPVIYLCLEGGGLFKRRLRAWCEEYGIALEELKGKLFIFSGDSKDEDGEFVFKLNTARGSEYLERIVETVERIAGRPPVLIIIDTLREALSGSVSDEKDVSPFIDAAKALSRCGAAVVAVGHVSKEDSKGAKTQRSPKGLSDWADRADTVVMKDASVNAGRASMFFYKVKNAPDKFEVKLSVHTVGDSVIQRAIGRSIPSEEPKRGGRRDVVSMAEYATWATVCGDVLRERKERLGGRPLAQDIANRLKADHEIERSAGAIRTLLYKAQGAADHEPAALFRHFIHPGTDAPNEKLEFSSPEIFGAATNSKRHPRITPKLAVDNAAMFEPVPEKAKRSRRTPKN